MYKKFGSYLKPEIFNFIKENYYKRGNEITLQDILMETTGEKLNPEFFLGMNI